MVTDIDPDVLDAYGFPRGAYVSEVVTGNCAKEAGVQVKDMIIAVGEYKVDSVNGLTRALQNFKGGEKTTVTVWRAGAEIVLDIVLDERPAPSAG
jgi:serine protease Do